MSLKDKIDSQLGRLSSQAGNGLLTVDTESGRLESELTAVDAIACAFDRFELKTDRLANATLDHLKKISDSLSSRLSYLLEPIALVESDQEHCVVQMRSNPPTKEDDATSYYELVVRRGGSLSLLRYSKSSGNARQTVPANVTREVFQRLAADFDAAVQ